MGTPSKMLTEKEEEIKEEYLKTLQDLTFNSKPLIDVLTEVAEENKEYASTIADCIVEQLEKVADHLKLPILYLIDSIIKNIGQHYMLLFCKNIDRLFTKVYEQGDEAVRNKLLKLRFTWNNIIPPKVLSSLDKMVQAVNSNWPNAPLVHVNPKFVSISTHVPASNGNITTTAHTPQTAPAFRIAPVSSQLINAAKRVRDPRLRKIELQQIRPSNNNSSTSSTVAVTKVVSSTKTPTTSSQQIDPKIDQKNDRRQQRIEVKKIAVTARPAPKESVRRPVEERVTRDRNVSSSGDTKKRKIDHSKTKEEEPANLTTMLKTWAQRDNERTVGRCWSKEERDKGLRTIAKALVEDKESEKVINDLSDKYPKIALKLEKLMKEIKGETTEKKKGSPAKKPIAGVAPRSATKSAPKRDRNASPKPTTKSSPSKIVVFSSTPAVDATVTVASPTSVKTTVSVSAAVESIPTPVVVSSSIPATPIPVSVPAAIPVTVAIPVPPSLTSMVTVSEKVTSTVSTISVTSTVPSTTASALSPAAPAASLSPASAPSPVIPTPPPAPKISSTVAVEQAKTQDIDYRQIFALQLLKPPPMVAEDEPKIFKESSPTDDVEIIDVDALPSKPKKRRNVDKIHHRNRKRRRTDSSNSDSSVSSKSSRDSVGKTEILKISEDEDSRSGTEPDIKNKPDDSFYSQTAPTEEKLQPNNLIIMSVSETPRIKSDSPPLFPKFDSNFGASFANADFPSSQSLTPEIPPTDMKIVEMIDSDPVRSINIDGVSREIRHYGSTAVVFMNWDDPRDISFFNGVRNVIIDDKFGIPCSLNAPEVETLVYGKKHRFRLGVPTRELYVDGIGYECYFGGPPLKIRLNYKINYIKLEGPPPSVNIGTIKRLDIVAGKISIIINDQHKFPIFLDAKPQYFRIDGKPVVIMFIDGLKRVLINNVPFRTDFGGPSQSFKIMNKVYYFRFTVLPLGIAPGINLSQMVVTKLPSPPPLPPQFQYSVSDNVPTPPLPPPQLTSVVAAVAPAIDLEPPTSSAAPNAAGPAGGILGDINLDELFQKLVASGIVPGVDNKADEGDDTVKIVDFDKPETLKQKQPALIKMLYSGIQCGSCGLRFPAEQTLKYSQHLDWHFRLNRRGKDGARTIHSRKWYYGKDDWIKFQEMEDNSDRGTSWFDNHPVTEYTEEILEDVPCIPAGSHQNPFCELCRDRFEQFYNDESDEWQLRNAIKVDDLIYHPICYQDHQIKLDQQKVDDEKEKETTPEETAEEEKPAEEKPSVPETSMDYDDDSDIEEVQVIEQPIEEIVIQDDGNDFDEPNLETLNTEEIIAAQQEIADEPEPLPKPIKMEEPDKIVDICDLGGENEPSFEEPETVEDSPQTKSGHEGVVTMDGNIELTDSPAQMMSGSTKIKINISKNINDDKANSPRNDEPKSTDNDDTTNDTRPPVIPIASDEEKLVPVSLKPRVEDAKLTVYPTVSKGTEESSLCSIM